MKNISLSAQLSALAVCSAFGLLTGACSSNSDDNNGAAGFKIAWMPKEQNNEVFDLGKEGAFAAAKEITTRTGDNVTVEYLAPTGSNAEEKVDGQIKLVMDAIAKKVNAISISCNDGVKLAEPLKKAVDSGIQVMTWDSDAPTSGRYTYYGIDNKAAGRAAATLLAKLIGDAGGQVAVISGTQGAANLDERVEGFSDEINANLSPKVQLIAPEYCDDDPATCASKVEEVMTKTPNLKGWFFAGLWALKTTSPTVPGETNMPTWEKASKDQSIKTVVFDTLVFELELLQAGKVHGLIGQKYYGWGFDSIQMSYLRLKNNKPFQSFTDSKFDVVCANNAADVMDMWAKKDFTKDLPACSDLK